MAKNHDSVVYGRNFMLKIFVSYVLGPFGIKVLDFYLKNSAIINSIIFIYGIFLVTCYLNYRKLIDAAYSQLKTNPPKKKEDVERLLNWEKIISENAFLPYIAGNLNLFPKKLNLDNFAKIRSKDKKWNERKFPTK